MTIRYVGGQAVLAVSKAAGLWIEQEVFPDTFSCLAWLHARRTPSFATTPPKVSLPSGDQICARSLYSGCGIDSGCPLGLPRCALWFGNERAGLSSELLHAVHAAQSLPIATATVRSGTEKPKAVPGSGFITVPMAGLVDSLNVAACLAIVVGEVCRQRILMRDRDSLRRQSTSGADADVAI
eukprot:SAG31_NODE_10748_length_1103_cov_0.935259_1_plen_181_part_10